MGRPETRMNYTIEILPDTFSICRLAPDAILPEWAQGDFVSITRTPRELSVVCRRGAVPNDVRCDTGWKCLRLAGQFDLTKVGVLASLTEPLAVANVSVFVIGTFDTDYLLVKNACLDSAIKALEEAGHSIHSPYAHVKHDRPLEEHVDG